MDKVALFFLFAIGCYLPALILSIMQAMFGEAPKPAYDPRGYGFNTPDQKQVLDILVACRKIQENIDKVANGSGGGGAGAGE